MSSTSIDNMNPYTIGDHEDLHSKLTISFLRELMLFRISVTNRNNNFHQDINRVTFYTSKIDRVKHLLEEKYKYLATRRLPLYDRDDRTHDIKSFYGKYGNIYREYIVDKANNDHMQIIAQQRNNTLYGEQFRVMDNQFKILDHLIKILIRSNGKN